MKIYPQDYTNLGQQLPPFPSILIHNEKGWIKWEQEKDGLYFGITSDNKLCYATENSYHQPTSGGN